ncbi:MAG: pyrroline-5-carboxylate reductase [Bacillota bacterium]|jgi:pyrroline-5-carboxylate reductase
MEIGIIGFGHLAAAFVDGVMKKGLFAGRKLHLYNRSQERLLKAEKELGAHIYADINQLIEASDVIILAVKPEVFPQLAPMIEGRLLAKKTLISFMAGTTMQEITDLLATDCQIVRVMPNIALKNAQSVTGMAANNYDRSRYAEIKKLFCGLGYVLEVTEDEIEKVTVLSGSGLGFAAAVLDNFVQAGVRLGFSPEQATKIVEQTFSGALGLGDFAKTVEGVATKGGVTEQGINVLRAYNVEQIVWETVDSAYKKTESIKRRRQL